MALDGSHVLLCPLAVVGCFDVKKVDHAVTIGARRRGAIQETM
jgi:hypothetical protein